ncbi:hypothetical protein C8J56DRAFT_1068934 [Mycena floridula]|nr:hypothetical protein C8J56DRAFT_1068934 [Mycena floridula]
MSFNFMPGPLFIYLVAAAFPVADLVWFSGDATYSGRFKSMLAESSKLTLAIRVFAVRAVIKTREFYDRLPNGTG